MEWMRACIGTHIWASKCSVFTGFIIYICWCRRRRRCRHCCHHSCECALGFLFRFMTISQSFEIPYALARTKNGSNKKRHQYTLTLCSSKGCCCCCYILLFSFSFQFLSNQTAIHINTLARCMVLSIIHTTHSALFKKHSKIQKKTIQINTRLYFTYGKRMCI